METEPIINVRRNELFQSENDFEGEELAGVYFKGIQYYDFKKVFFVNNYIIVKLVFLLKTLLKQQAEIKLVNVSKKIKRKLNESKLEKALKYQ